MIKYLLILVLVLLQGCSALSTLPTKILYNQDPQAFLRDDKYKNLVIEILAVSGASPAVGSVDYLVTQAQTLIHKNTIKVVYQPIIPFAAAGNETSWNTDKLHKFKDKFSKIDTKGDTLVLHILFVPGRLDDGATSVSITGALTFDPYIFAVFRDPSYGNFGLEPDMLLHEFGHILGLVDGGSAPQSNHIDSDHPDHCKNTRCLMYWISPKNGKFDVDCLKDLKANGGK